MPIVLKLRRGDTTASNAFTGAEGEITIDTTKDTLVVHDGATAGGKPLATEANLNSGLATKANISSLSAVATSGSYVDLTNKPTLFSGSYVDLTNKPSIPSLTGYATESYVNNTINNVVGAAPAALDTLNELAAALNNDASFASTITTSLASKANTSSLAAVATSGSYADLSNKPTIPTNTNELMNGAGFITSSAVSGKQDTLVSGTSIKTVNSTSLLGSGNIAVQATLVSGTNIKTVNSTTLLGSGDIAVQATLVSGTNIKTVNSTSLLGSGNIAVQPTLVSGTNIKTVGSTSLLGSGDISFKTVNGNSLLGSGDIAISGGGVDYSTVYEIKLGLTAGSYAQGGYGIAIGYSAGNYNQGSYGISIGRAAGESYQTNYAIAIGNYAGNNSQGDNAIAIGNNAGNNAQAQNAIAIGNNAGSYNQGSSAIAIGNNATGTGQQSSNSIVLNATGSAINANASGFFVKPIRSGTAAKIIYYDSTTGELTYGDAPVSGGGGDTGTNFSQPLQFVDFDPSGPGTITLAFTSSTSATNFLASVGNNTVTITGLQSGPSTLTIVGGNWSALGAVAVRLTAPMTTPDLYGASGGQPLSFNGGTAAFTSSGSGGGGTVTYGYNSGGILGENYNPGTGYTEFTVSSTDAALFATDYNSLKNTIANIISSASMTGVNAYSNSMAILVTNTTYHPITQTQQVTSGAGQVVFSNMNSTPGIPLSNFPNFTLGAGLYVNHNFSLMLGGSSITYSYNAGTCTVSSGSGFSNNDYAGALNQAVSAYAAIARISGAAMTLGGTSYTDGFSGGMVTFAGVSNFTTSGQDLQFSYQTVIEPFTNGGPSALMSLTPRKQ